MAQFDVYENPSPDSSSHFPYLLDVQSGALSDLPTRVVVPLATPSAWGSQHATRLNPVLSIRGKICVMLTVQIAGVSVSSLGSRVANLANARTEIIGAVDLLITGI